MRDASSERWKALCKAASIEQDPEKFLELIQEINRLLEEKRMNPKQVDGNAT